MRKNWFANWKNPKFLWAVGMSLLLLMFVPKLSLAQAVGQIQGTVQDSSGAMVPQATVTVVDTDTNDTRTAKTDSDGSFRFPALVTGHYSVKVEKEGFKTRTQTGLTLEVTQELVVNPVLEVGSVTQDVTVNGQETQVDTTNSSLGGLVNEAKMSELPLNGRNYDDLTTMQPGVASDSNASGAQGQGGTRGLALTSDGAGIRANVFIYDGGIVTSSNGENSGLVGTTLGLAGIKEFKVVTGAYDASYGLLPGAQVAMVSKGGTNIFHGEAFEYLRNSALDAANYFDHPVAANNFLRLPPFRRNNFGGAFGGPIKADKTFFFGAYEGLRQVFGQTIIDTVPGAGCHGAAGTVITSTACPQLGSGASSVQIAPVVAGNGVPGSTGLLGLLPIPNLPNNQYTFPNPSPTTVNWGQIRVDQNISASDTLFGRYNIGTSYNSGANGYKAATSSAYPNIVSVSNSMSQWAVLSESHIFSPSLLNQVQLAYTRYATNGFSQLSGEAATVGSQYSQVLNEPGGNFTISGLSAYAGDGGPSASKEDIYTLNDDLYWTKGKHALRFGFVGHKYNVGGFDSKNLFGQTRFTNLANFLQGEPTSYLALQLGAQGSSIHNMMWLVPGAYAQDDWHVVPRLTLNIGVRYEFSTQMHDTLNRASALVHPQDSAYTVGPPMAPTPKYFFAPRLGFAWDVRGNGKTAVRGGAGLYFETGNYVGFDPGGWDEVVSPHDGSLSHNSAPGYVMTLPLTFFSTDALAEQNVAYNVNVPYMLKWNLAVERQLPWGVAVLVGYVGTRGVHQYNAEEGNPVIPAAIVSGVPYWNGTTPRQNPNFDTIQYETTTGESDYNGGQLAVNKRVSHGIEFQTSYTFSHALDSGISSFGPSDCLGASGMTVPDYTGGPGYNYASKTWGSSCSDARHILHINVLYHIPNIESNNFAAKLEHGWWSGVIWGAQSGYPFTPVLGAERSQSKFMTQFPEVDYVNLATSADSAFCTSNPGCKYTPVPFNPKTVIKHNPVQWFNPDMFTMAPMTTGPGNGVTCTSSTCTTGAYGTLGNSPRGLLRGPGLDEVDFSVNKDTHLPFLGELGILQFRAEMFNILNHPSFAMPTGTVFSGATTDYGAYSESPGSSAGAVTSTVNTSRQIQFSLRIAF
jgi:hypothetical protein